MLETFAYLMVTCFYFHLSFYISFLFLTFVFTVRIGKTLLAKTLARVVNVPFAIADATTLTQASSILYTCDVVLYTVGITSTVYLSCTIICESSSMKFNFE